MKKIIIEAMATTSTHIDAALARLVHTPMAYAVLTGKRSGDVYVLNFNANTSRYGFVKWRKLIKANMFKNGGVITEVPRKWRGDTRADCIQAAINDDYEVTLCDSLKEFGEYYATHQS